MAARGGPSKVVAGLFVARGAQPSLWTLRGVLAANAAMDKARRNDEWDAAPPVEARAAGNDAERAWLEGFVNTFKPHGAQAEPARDRRVSGLTAPKRRRVTNKPEANKVGKAGLEASAESVVSNFVYAWVRAHFFLPAEHLCKEVRSALKEDGFECTEDDLDEWWEERGHSLVLSKARARGTASWTRSRLACGSFTVRLAASAICRANNRRHAQLAPRSHPPLMSSLSLERNASATTTRKRRERRRKRSSSRGAPRRTTCPLRGGKQAAAVVASLVSQSGLLRSRWASKRPRTRRALPFGSLH